VDADLGDAIRTFGLLMSSRIHRRKVQGFVTVEKEFGDIGENEARVFRILSTQDKKIERTGLVHVIRA
jgi:hypothetical protein